MQNRRGFLGMLAAAIAGATLDPERLLWEPGKKLISIAAPRELRIVGETIHVRKRMRIVGETILVRKRMRFLPTGELGVFRLVPIAQRSLTPYPLAPNDLFKAHG